MLNAFFTLCSDVQANITCITIVPILVVIVMSVTMFKLSNINVDTATIST